MIKLLLVLLFLVSPVSKGEVTLRGGVTLSGNVTVSAPSSPIRADAVQLFTGQTVGNYITDAQLNTDKLGLGSWGIFMQIGPQPPTYHTWKCVSNTSVAFLNPVVVNGQTITETGTQWIEADYGQDKLDTIGHTFDGSGNYTFSCEQGIGYIWYKNGATNIINGTNTYTVTALGFIAATNTLTLTGTPGNSVLALVVKYLEAPSLTLPGGASPTVPATNSVIRWYVRLPSLTASAVNNNLDLVDTEGNPYAVAQLQMIATNDYRLIAHGPGGSFGWVMPLASNHVYEMVMQRDDTTQTVTVEVYDPSNNFASISGPMTGSLGGVTGFMWFVRFQANYLDIGGVAGKLQYGGISVSWTNHDSRP